VAVGQTSESTEPPRDRAGGIPAVLEDLGGVDYGVCDVLLRGVMVHVRSASAPYESTGHRL